MAARRTSSSPMFMAASRPRLNVQSIPGGTVAPTVAPTQPGDLIGDLLNGAGGDKNVSAICTQGLGHLYLVMGERRAGEGGGPATWLIRSYVNPLAWLIFVGPALMALGGFISLSDRRLRLGVARRAAPALARPPHPRARSGY